MAMYSLNGRQTGSVRIIDAPAARPVVGDLDGDGVNDIILVGRRGRMTGYIVSEDVGGEIILMTVLAVLVAMLTVMNSAETKHAKSAAAFGVASRLRLRKRATD